LKILVTGGAGFIASQVAEAYVARGHRVAVVDDLSRGKLGQVPKAARFYRADICDRKKMRAIFRREKPQVVNHHAAQIEVRKSVADPELDARINILGSLNLLQLAAASGVKKFILASTGGALYGEQDYFPADEQHPIRPLSPYGVAKAAIEMYLYYFRAVQGVEYVALRYSNVYGPRQDPFGEAGVVAIFCEKLWRGQTCVINGPGRQTRDFVYVGDVVRANLLALKPRITGSFNIATGKETTVNRVHALLARAVGSRMKPVHGPAKKGEQKRSVLDVSLARKVLRWQPQVSLEQGLKLTAEFFRP